MALRQATQLLALFALRGAAVDLNVDSTSSIKDAASTIAYGLMSSYDGNRTGSSTIGIFNPPYYWWEAGATWGGLISYWAYTNDSSYNPTVTQALLFQTGPDLNYQPPNQTKDLGNDDQAYWALACMDALELGFPNPPSDQPQWLQLATNVWNAQAARWDTKTCGGGLKWQIFSFNVGYDYKNSGSNTNFFQLSARLARYTGNQTYAEWANKTWDWMSSIGLIDSEYSVFDGTNDITNCTEVNHIQWSSDSAALLYGSAILSNVTNSSSLWSDRASKLAAKAMTIFTAQNNSTGQRVLSEVSCESNTPINCNTDQVTYKGFLARWLARATLVMPSLREQAYPLIRSSAQAAAQSCSGGANQTDCGLTWTGKDTHDQSGLSEQLAALDVVQSLILYNSTSVKLLKQNESSASNTNATNGGTGTPGSGGTATQNGTGGSGGTGAASALNVADNLVLLCTITLVGLMFQQFL